MNRHGQTLVLFVIILPILLLFIAFIIDTSYIINKKIELKEVSKMVIIESINKSEEQIKELFNKNKINTENIIINLNEDKIEIKNEYNIDSILGNIVGIKTYKIRVDITGIKKNNKIIFE